MRLVRWLRILAAALALSACVAAPIDRADRAAETRIEQAAQEARQIAQDAARRLDDVRAAGVADLAQRHLRVGLGRPCGRESATDAAAGLLFEQHNHV